LSDGKKKVMKSGNQTVKRKKDKKIKRKNEEMRLQAGMERMRETDSVEAGLNALIYHSCLASWQCMLQHPGCPDFHIWPR
jgi:hypothetical protein